jgi:hypothetical protein
VVVDYTYLIFIVTYFLNLHLSNRKDLCEMLDDDKPLLLLPGTTEEEFYFPELENIIISSDE